MYEYRIKKFLKLNGTEKIIIKMNKYLESIKESSNLIHNSGSKIRCSKTVRVKKEIQIK